jgi:hypothetical protein
MREIHSHKVNPVNDALRIEVADEPGAGGANHRYEVTGMNYASNPSAIGAHPAIVFQNGPIAEAGVNGVTHEALLAIVVDRLESFQTGPYACRENALALTKLQEAQMWLLERTRGRIARGVEGTHAK